MPDTCSKPYRDKTYQRRQSDRIVWIAGAEGDIRLRGFRGDSGQPVFTGGGPDDRIPGLRHFVTILAADRRLYVAGDGRIYAFNVAP